MAPRRPSILFCFFGKQPPIYIYSTLHANHHIIPSLIAFFFSFLSFPLFWPLFCFLFLVASKVVVFFLLSSICHLEFFQPTHTYTHTHRIFTVFPFSKRLCFVWFYPDDVRNASPSKLFAQKENKERERRERWRLDNARPSVLYMRVRDTPDTDIFRESRTIDVE